MSTSMLPYPPHVQVTNTYHYAGAPMDTVSDADIAVLARQMRASRIEEQKAQTENHDFLIQYK